MKRNMVPLLGIAFVVAIISTGVFYGLFAGRLHSASADGPGQSIVVAGRNLDRGTVIQASDLRVSQLKGTLKGSFAKPQDVVGATLLEAVNQNEPLLDDRVASLDAKSTGPGQRVPAGMRAVSVRVSESTGVVGLLHGGSRVDVQAVLERSGTAEVRTILQNVEVLAVGQQNEPVPGRPPAPVVTVLARAQDSDSIALADSSARIRVALRNPLDEATSPRHSLGLTALFNGSTTIPITQTPLKASAGQGAVPATAPTVSNFDHPILLRVQVLGASAEALKELDSRLTAPDTNGSWNVASFRSDTDAADLVRALEQKQELEVVSAWKFTAGIGRPVSFRAGEAPYQLRVQFSPETESGGKVCLRVKPETIFQRGEGVETRKYDAGLPDGGSFLVRGFLKDPSDRKILDRLYPGHSWGARDLVILVTARADKQLPASAFAQANRGQ
jgi:pilus assembly protein CpaB